VGALTSRRTFGDSLSLFDTVDTYRFSVTSGRTYNFTASADDTLSFGMRLIRDGNNNREVDTGDVLAQSFGQSNGTEAINQFLSPGTYYLQVDKLGTTNYTLSMG
jgi:hypothetical protein